MLQSRSLSFASRFINPNRTINGKRYIFCLITYVGCNKAIILSIYGSVLKAPTRCTNSVILVSITLIFALTVSSFSFKLLFNYAPLPIRIFWKVLVRLLTNSHAELRLLSSSVMRDCSSEIILTERPNVDASVCKPCRAFSRVNSAGVRLSKGSIFSIVSNRCLTYLILSANDILVYQFGLTFSSVSLDNPLPSLLSLLFAVAAVAVTEVDVVSGRRLYKCDASLRPDLSSFNRSSVPTRVSNFLLIVSRCLGCERMAICCSSLESDPTRDDVTRLGG